MYKKELIKEVANQAEQSEKTTKDIIYSTLEIIARELSRGREVNLTGFGKFYVKEYPEREAKTPQGKTITINKRQSPRFKASRPLRQRCK